MCNERTSAQIIMREKVQSVPSPYFRMGEGKRRRRRDSRITAVSSSSSSFWLTGVSCLVFEATFLTDLLNGEKRKEREGHVTIISRRIRRRRAASGEWVLSRPIRSPDFVCCGGCHCPWHQVSLSFSFSFSDTHRHTHASGSTWLTHGPGTGGRN